MNSILSLIKLISLPFLFLSALFSSWFGGQQEMRVIPDLHVEAQINYGLALAREGDVYQTDGAAVEEYFSQWERLPINVGTGESVSVYTDQVQNVWPAYQGKAEFSCWKLGDGKPEKASAPGTIHFNIFNRRSGGFSITFDSPLEEGQYLYLVTAEFKQGIVEYIFELNVNDLYSDNSGGQQNGIDPPQIPEVPADFDHMQAVENGWTVLEQDGTFYGKDVLDQFVADVQNQVEGRRELVMIWALGEGELPIVQVVTYENGGLRCDASSAPVYTYQTIEVEETEQDFTYFYRDYDGTTYLMLHIMKASIQDVPSKQASIPNVGELTPEQIDFTGVVTARQGDLIAVSGTTQDGSAVELVLNIGQALIKDINNQLCSSERVESGVRICVVLEGADLSAELLQGNAKYIYLIS